MEAPDESPATNGAITDNKLPDPATSIRCVHCNRHFASISVEGGLIPATSQTPACASCEPFLGLYETLQTREQEHTALLDRGQKHHGRAIAHEKYRNARVALENFLMSIEAPNEATFDLAQAGFANRADPAQLEHADDVAEGPKFDETQQPSDRTSPPMESVPPPGPSPTLKRKVARNPRASNGERKRIKFTETVEERPEYRGSLEFYRGAKEYVPGRYKAAEGSEFLDTSGSTLTFAKFTGQKKVGSMFIDIVSREEALEGEGGSPAMKKKGKAKDNKKQSGQEEVRWEPRKEASQASSRELRNPRRSRSITPPLTTRPRRKIAHYDGQDDEAAEPTQDQPSLVVALKASLPNNGSTRVTRDVPPNSIKRTEDIQLSPYGHAVNEADIGKVDRKSAEAVTIIRTVANIRRELSILQQTIFTPKFRDTVSTAIHGFFEVLEPLEAAVTSRPTNEENTEEAAEEDRIYFEALDTAVTLSSTNTQQSVEPSRQSKSEPLRTDAAAQVNGADAIHAGSTLDANALDAMPKQDKQNTSGELKLDKLEKDRGERRDRPMPSIEAASGETSENKRVTLPKSIKDSKDARHQSARSQVLSRSKVEPRGRSRKTAPPNYQSLSYNFDEAPTPVSSIAKASRRAQVVRSKKSLAPFTVTLLEGEDIETEDEELNTSNTKRLNRASALEQTGHTKAAQGRARNPPSYSTVEPLSVNLAFGVTQHANGTTHQGLEGPLNRTLHASSIEPPQDTLLTAGDSTNSYDDGSIWGVEPPLKPVQQISPSYLSHNFNEAAGSVHQYVGELINNSRDDKQGTHAQSESEATNGSPQTNNIDQDLDTTPAGSGEISRDSESDVTVTDRSATGEAQVDTDTAHHSAQVKTINDRDLSADRNDQTNIETVDEDMHDAVEQSSEKPRDKFGDGDEAKVEMAVASPRNHRTAASQVGGPMEPMKGAGVRGNELVHSVTVVAGLAAKAASHQDNR